MNTINALLLLVCLAHKSMLACPTCLGLPRPHERPFFERKSFLNAVQEDKNQKKSHKKTVHENTLNKKKDPYNEQTL